MDFKVIAWVAAAGAVGAVSRYLAILLVRHWWGPEPLPVAVVNLVGCFGFGLCWALSQDLWSHRVATAVLAGFFGAFTTFSSFAFDGQQLLVAKRFGAFAANLLAQNGLGVLALWLGMLAGGLRR